MKAMKTLFVARIANIVMWFHKMTHAVPAPSGLHTNNLKTNKQPKNVASFLDLT